METILSEKYRITVAQSFKGVYVVNVYVDNESLKYETEKSGLSEKLPVISYLPFQLYEYLLPNPPEWDSKESAVSAFMNDLSCKFDNILMNYGVPYCDLAYNSDNIKRLNEIRTKISKRWVKYIEDNF